MRIPRKSKVVGEFVSIDKNTGEVLESQTIKCPIEDPYRKFYFDYDYRSIKGSFRELFSFAMRMSHSGDDDGGNIVRVDKFLIEKMSNECGISCGRFKSIIKEFLNRGILRRINRGVYQVNPYICGIGSWKSIEKLRYEWDKAKAEE